MAFDEIIVNGLNLNADVWEVDPVNTRVPNPPIKRQVIGSLYVDGEEIPATALGNRTLTIEVFLLLGAENADDYATHKSALDAALDDEEFDTYWGPEDATFECFQATDYEIVEQNLSLGYHKFRLNIPARPLAVS